MSEIEQMTYEPPSRDDDVVEVMSFTRLRRIDGGGTQRADFFVLAVVESGQGLVSVDFGAHRLQPQSVVLIPPGAVHRFDDIADVGGLLALFVPTTPINPIAGRLLGTPSWVPVWSPGRDWTLVVEAARHLRIEAAASVHVPGIREAVLLALLLRVGRSAPQRPPAGSLFERFAAEVEGSYRSHHDAAHYADVLGYSPRTLSRAVRSGTGVTAKTFIAERLTLEAKRLLAHDGLTAAQTSDRLGFADPASFSAFFTRTTGVRPGAWQATNRPGRTTTAVPAPR